MANLATVRSYLDRDPGAAAADVLALVAICLLILAGFSLPAAF